MNESPFVNDPFSLVWKAFKSLYPDAECECQWIPDLPEYMGLKPRRRKKGPFGATVFPEDGGKPQVLLDACNSIVFNVEIFAHELAHVAVGVDDEHGPLWEEAFDKIHTAYNYLADKEAEKLA